MMVNDRRSVTAGEVDLCGQGAVVKVLIAVQVEQRIFAMQPVKLFGNHVHDYIVPVFSAKAMVTVSGDHLDLVIDDAHDSDVERAAAEVENENGLVLIELVEAIGKRGGSWLVDNLKNVQAGELTSRDRGGALRIVEISRNSDDRVGDPLFEILFRIGY